MNTPVTATTPECRLRHVEEAKALSKARKTITRIKLVGGLGDSEQAKTQKELLVFEKGELLEYDRAGAV